MQVKLEITGLKELQDSLKGFSDRRMSAVVATALTRTARSIEASWSKTINSTIDRPTERTKKSVFVKKASASSLVAEVGLKDTMNGMTPQKYLSPHEFSGSRLLKKFEQALVKSGAMPAGYFVVPGRSAELDAHGNVSRAQITHVITQLGADFSVGYQQTISKKTDKRLKTAAKHGRKYVSVHPNQARKFKVSAGIYELQPDGSRKAVFLFKSAVSYRKRLSLIEEGKSLAEKTMKVEFDKAFSESYAKLLVKQSS
jgi:hypothetical protein